MKYKVTAPAHCENISIGLPSSKSISNRAIILNALSYTPELPHNLSDCDDTRVMINAFNSDSAVFDIGAAGTSMRFLTAYLSKIAGVWEITGSERMKNRPIGTLVNALREVGANIEYLEKEGYPPLKITGRALKGGEIELNGGISSQFISALLMIGPAMRDGLTINLTGNVISVPYIKMTLSMMKSFGIESTWTDNKITIAPQSYRETDYFVESDWSAASYWYEIAVLSGTGFTLKGLKKESLQGDSKIADYFKLLGIDTVYNNDEVTLVYNEAIRNKNEDFVYHIDLSGQPDLAQTLVVCCAMTDTRFRFEGLQTLKIKETDRIEALKKELLKLGYVVRDIDDSVMEWDGTKTEPCKKPVIDTYEDHRMAMAFAPAAFRFSNLYINHPGVVSKSYPRYWDDLRKAGFILTEA